MARGQARNNGDGLLVDTIYYESPGVLLTEKAAQAVAGEEPSEETKVGQVRIPVEVRLRKSFRGAGTDRPVDQLQFSLVCRRPLVTLRGTDIEALRRAMWAELDASTAIRWEDYLLVTIEPAGHYGEGVGEGLRLHEKTVWKGTTQDGYRLLRQNSHDALGSGWTYESWPETFTDKAGRVTACIPATAANTQAMEEFRDHIRALRARLRSLVRPDTIMTTLANLSGTTLLPPPAAEPEHDQNS